MDEYDFTHDMSDEQIKLAKAAGRLARKHASGSTLYDALTIGESLLVGRAVAMKAAGLNRPFGKRYAEAFAAWKNQFGFVSSKHEPLPAQYLENCIAAAANRTVADQIIAELSPNQRAGMGISGLAARVRAKVSGEAKPRMTPSRQILEQLGLRDAGEDRKRSVDAALRRCGLVVVDNEVVVVDQGKFEAWLHARKPRLLGGAR